MTSARRLRWMPTGALAAWLIASNLTAGWAAEPASRENLARDKPASASSTQDDSKWAGAATDGDLDSRWCASDGALPQWLRVDLARPETLTGCRITWERAGIAYQYTVEGSPDTKTWTVLVDASRATAVDQVRTHSLTAQGVRYVRLNIVGTAAGQWASLFEFEVLGTKAAPAVAANPVRRDDPQTILKEVKVPPGFAATVFATPPDIRYPTCLAAAPTGEVFVGVDENGSLDAKANRGRVVRCVDKDGDGTADQFNVFAAMDSPRGLAWDAGTLYVLHPPSLSAFHDTDGDGVADRTETLVSGIGFDLKQRGADHTTNGIRLAIDGFLYVAVGDYGFVQAQGKDGEPLQLLGGGVVRVRTDGTGLEIISRGQRNIYDVAIDPRMNLFTRDNTNDGDGWDVRLSHVIPTGHYGYPSLFKRFSAEIIPPLADYGGGSPCGSLFLQEPGWPAGFGATLYTCEWGRGAVFTHPLAASGATFQAKQETFVTMPRPTDIDVDGSGRVYISSWRDGGFSYSRPNIGYVIRVVPTGLQAKPFGDLTRAAPAALVLAIQSESSVLRLAAQRELLRRGVDTNATQRLEAACRSAADHLEGRIAAVFTLAQGLGPRADGWLIELARSTPDLREAAVQALGNRRDPGATPSTVAQAVGALLTDANPRVRLAAVIATGRFRDLAVAPTLLGLTTDLDPIVAHAAVRALIGIKAIDACLFALTDPTLAAGAARALQAMHDPAAVAGLLPVAEGGRGAAARRFALGALCRLYFTEAPYEAGHWWGTRPDTSGPYYKGVTWSGSDAVARGLQAALKSADPALASWLLNEMIRNKVDFEDSTPLAVRLAANDPEIRAAVINLMVGRPQLTPAAIEFLQETATRTAVPDPVQMSAIRGLLKHQDQPAALVAALRSLAISAADEAPSGDLIGVWTDTTRDNRRLGELDRFTRLAEGADEAEGTLGYAVLLGALANPKATEAAQGEADAALGRGWQNPAWTPRLLRAVGLAKVTRFGGRVQAALGDNRTEIRQAAEFAARRMNIAPRGGAKAGPTPRAIASTPYESVLAAALADPGDVALGTRLFERQGCVNCHAVAKSGPIKGPYLGDVAARYNRSELVESILKPSARIAQGFETQKIATSKGQTIEGFVVREAGDEVELRNSAGNVVLIPKGEIEERGKSDISVMPQGLLDPLTPHDLASLLAYLESIKGK